MWRTGSIVSLKKLSQFVQISNRNVVWRLYHAQSGCFGYRPLPQVLVEGSKDALENRNKNADILRLVTAYRVEGHKNADVDPLNTFKRNESGLSLSKFGLDDVNLNKKFKLSGLLHCNGQEEASMKEILEHLENVYCGQLSVEVQHIVDESEKLWLAALIEESVHWPVETERQVHLAKLLLRSQAFDNFLAKKFPTVKRYGAEGAESMLAFFDELFLQSSYCEIQELVLGMPHRGRLNLLTDSLKFPAAQMFSKINFMSSKNASSVDLDFGHKSPLHVTMLPNPSHLEAVNPVSTGKARGRQLTLKDGCYSDSKAGPIGDKVLNVIVHGDASFSAQGIVAELLCLANLPHFSVGGTIHLIVNNQLGFTTPGERGRGHNEIDDPSFTQPTMYQKIENRGTVPDLYAESLVTRGLVTEDELTKETSDYTLFLNEELKQSDDAVPLTTHLGGHWKGLVQASYHVRFSGQDVGRGTFSHRHAMLVDQSTDEMFVPLNTISEQQKAFLEVQVMVISKWLMQSGLVMLLPHGYDGAGPEHSSCRLERFLQLTDSKEDVPDGESVNMHIVNPTTPAQYFHSLRQQAAVSSLHEMGPRTHFKPVLGDDIVDRASVSRVVFCSGKHYYALAKQRETTNGMDTAIIRLESLCPFPYEFIRQELQKFPGVKAQICWSQSFSGACSGHRKDTPTRGHRHFEWHSSKVK
ncbi:2-oxoadipate dehydrogenase complex component E1 [Acropora cervicornis]|uniref:2-oxoadipate dehydrogenase complex component E1 n=1 Tax=Acropora cervicornis TaxID=6130 RepID=A0AAD9QU02_ACRCE|nr:2-oxoadipate dehydrogenase complex component E1 [Acropora cervicornis]